jgi:hypothetical protein
VFDSVEEHHLFKQAPERPDGQLHDLILRAGHYKLNFLGDKEKPGRR